MPSYQTHVALKITWEAGATHHVYLEGEQRKTLYHGPDAAEAQATYDEVVTHYEERKQAAGTAAESEVSFVPRATPEARSSRERERKRLRGE